MAPSTDQPTKKSLACGNNGKYGKYGIQMLGTSPILLMPSRHSVERWKPGWMMLTQP